MIRNGCIYLAMLDAMQVAPQSDLANWTPSSNVQGFGGAMDPARNPSTTKAVVAMERTDKSGNSKIVSSYTLPPTGEGNFGQIITTIAFSTQFISKIVVFIQA
jgi:acyl CoA:acetate/3-ketoacid CoA transferase beta subunit